MNLQKIFWGLEELSDRDLQEKLWQGQNSGECSSFIEAISLTFDDSDLGRAIDSGHNLNKLSPDAIRKFIILRRLISKVEQNAPPRKIIDDLAMIEIRKLASDLIKILKKENKIT
jgi:hypothetical protein